jgi:hypothetical protein
MDETIQSARAESYIRVMDTLRDLGESSLLPEEREIVREACDALLFGEEHAVEALREAQDVCSHLAQSKRWRRRRAAAFRADIEGCADPALLAAV